MPPASTKQTAKLAAVLRATLLSISLILFGLLAGGLVATRLLGDTGEWDGTTWRTR